eukprot:TRINITY_DN8329_c0_g1_i1.p1 TRINITY_DN8329_c0_g1~~TRINITY_DN8329_c0_g1_i1.p1  ORF type:complete len:327 (+),score=58.09 TRINITY_DN8329_c0_g1_i1:89-982(+)
MSDGDDNVFIVERLLQKKRFRNEGIQYFVKWAGYPDNENSWVKQCDILDPDLITMFEEQERAKRKVHIRAAPESPVQILDSPVRTPAPPSAVREQPTATNAAVPSRDEVVGILGCKNSPEDGLLFRCLWRSGQKTFVTNNDLRADYPVLLLDYYQARVRFAARTPRKRTTPAVYHAEEEEEEEIMQSYVHTADATLLQYLQPDAQSLTEISSTPPTLDVYGDDAAAADVSISTSYRGTSLMDSVAGTDDKCATGDDESALVSSDGGHGGVDVERTTAVGFALAETAVINAGSAVVAQ